MIIRRKVNRNFTIIPNEPVNDDRLGFEELGLLTYLLSRPDDWRVMPQQLQGRGSRGRNKVYALINSLIESGYIVRQQARDDSSHKFEAYEYVVYDEPTRSEPCPENEEAAISQEIEPRPCFPYPVKGDHTKYLSNQTPYGENSSAPNGAGADAPSVNAEIWKEGLTLLKTSLSDQQSRKLLGRWCQQASSEEKKTRLLAIVRAAKRAGTGDPVSYISRAVNEAFPPPPDPKQFTEADWKIKVQAAIKFGEWPPEWGPAPGKGGCLVPTNLISPELVTSIGKKGRAVSSLPAPALPSKSPASVKPREYHMHKSMESVLDG